MALKDITRTAVLDAMAEHDRIGREHFLERYGFGRSRGYWLIHDGHRYDSKAIAGVAHGYLGSGRIPLRSDQFSGGDATVSSTLERLGFVVERATDDASDPLSTSSRLAVGEVYSRARLSEIFGITDATIKTGVFRPAGTNSIWLFVTERKSADRTQYADRFDGENLVWQGQLAGRTDTTIINHRRSGFELLVFYRKTKTEHPQGGFRYLGRFNYLSHSGAYPTTFVLVPVDGLSAELQPGEADLSSFDPDSIVDAREIIARQIKARRGQQRFRQQLIAAYGGRCAISGCAVLDVLEAAHIYPYLGPATNRPDNGLLLRADLHTLFDCDLIAIDPQTLKIATHPSLAESEYRAFAGKPIAAPIDSSASPSSRALHQRWSARRW